MKNSILECETLEEVEELKNHKDWWARIDAYRTLGFTEKQFDDAEPY